MENDKAYKYLDYMWNKDDGTEAILEDLAIDETEEVLDQAKYIEDYVRERGGYETND